MADTLNAVITGASRGIGHEVARQLAARDVRVTITGRSREALDSALAELQADGRQMDAHILDVASGSSVDAFFDAYWQRFERLDILVNNAARTFGDWQRSGIEDTAAETIVDALNNNTVGAYRMVRHALSAMNRVGFGRIVNVSTGMAGLSEMGGGSVAYRLSKTALNALTRVAHAEAGPNVKVNSVCPGWVRTDMGGSNATRDISEGAAGVVWAAMLGEDGPSGGFFRDGKPIDW